MGKMYTLEGKLLCELPEIRVDQNVYPVDNRKGTVDRMNEIMNGEKADGSATDEVLKLALGEEGFARLDPAQLPFPAYQRLFELVVAAMTGESPAAVAGRFQPDESV